MWSKIRQLVSLTVSWYSFIYFYNLLNDLCQGSQFIFVAYSNYMISPFRSVACWLLEKIVYMFPEEYAREMKASVDGGNACLFSDRAVGCTSIVAEDESGRILHGRNLDYPMTELLKNLSVIVEFTRNNEIQYTGLTFAYYSGLMTGQKPFAYTFSSNARRTGWYIYTLLMEMYTGFRMPIGLGIRQMFEVAKTYNEALEYLKHIEMITPCYFVLGGTKSGEGVLLTRDRMNTVDVKQLNVKKNQWFIVQTNFDHWSPDEDNRRTTAEIFLNEIKHANLDEDTLWSVLDHTPVRNNLTVTKTVMSAHTPAMLYRNTGIDDYYY
uniref:CBAH domain-containing protein n=1 Tax=Syphacia muris TaxID=451379 RepID=A0A0N5AF45_9BILA